RRRRPRRARLGELRDGRLAQRQARQHDPVAGPELPRGDRRAARARCRGQAEAPGRVTPRVLPSGIVPPLASIAPTRGGEYETGEFFDGATESVAAPGDRGVRCPLRPQGRTSRTTPRGESAEGEPPGGDRGRPPDG